MIPSRRDDRERFRRALARASDELRGLARGRTGGAPELDPVPAERVRGPGSAPARRPLPLRRRPL